jgi:hypothetical protein
MKLYRRDAFMELPAGTLYCKGKPWYFESLHVKAQTLRSVEKDDPFDWVCLSLDSVEANDSEQFDARLTDMLENGASYPMADAYGRDGCFDKDDLFLVYEVEDLKRLHEIICNAVKVA